MTGGESPMLLRAAAQAWQRRAEEAEQREAHLSAKVETLETRLTRIDQLVRSSKGGVLSAGDVKAALKA